MKSMHSRQANTPEQRNKAAKGAICEMLAWDEFAYAEFQYDMGKAYLRFYIPMDVQGVDLLTRDRLFWNWWKNHWINRDEQFIKDVRDRPLSRKILMRLYLGLNNPETLATEIYPNGVILGDCFAQIINEQKAQTA